MKVEELYTQNKDSEVGVTFQRQPFETQVGIFPEISPLENPRMETVTQEGGEPVESTLTSVQMEEAVCRAVRHRGGELQPIPLKRVDSGPTSHRIQASETLETEEVVRKARHEELLDEIDNAGENIAKDEVKTKKKEGTLSRMKERLKSMQRERGEKDDEGKTATKSLSKIFQRVKPVGKASRESFSKVFHRIGDALQRKDEDKDEKKDKGLSVDPQESDAVDKTLKHRSKEM